MTRLLIAATALVLFASPAVQGWQAPQGTGIATPVATSDGASPVGQQLVGPLRELDTFD